MMLNLVKNTSAILKQFCSNPRKIIIPLKRLNRGSPKVIEANLISIIYDGVLQYLLKQTCNDQEKQKINFTKILNIIELNQIAEKAIL